MSRSREWLFVRARLKDTSILIEDEVTSLANKALV